MADYKYDVAFSFLGRDESLAVELNDLLQDRLKTFLYSKRQEEVAGTDGERTFNSVFGEQSRAVAVLYRDGWGQTPWTRIEETAIRNRAYEHGYDFVKFIPLDKDASVPRWLPRTQLWIGLEQWGIRGAASVIEARVQELGGEPRGEAIEDRAVRLEREQQFQARRRDFLKSEQGVTASVDAFEALRLELERQISSVKATAPSISLDLKAGRSELVVRGLSDALGIYWKYRWTNSLDGAALEVSLWTGHPPFTGVMHFEKPKQLSAMRFTFDLLPTGPAWVSTGDERAYTIEGLATAILKFYMDHAT